MDKNNSSNQWYPFYVGDYNRKTAHLSLLEHGAYRRLIDHYMATKLPLPNDPVKLYRICGANSPNERKAVLSAAYEFFTQVENVLINERCSRELDKQLKFSNSQSAKARLRHSRGSAQSLPTTTTTTKVSKKESKISKITASRFQLDAIPQDWINYCKLKRPDLNPDDIFDAFRDWWIAQPGSKGLKLDWYATWRTWIRNQKKTNGVLYADNKPKSQLERAIEATERARIAREQRSSM